MFNARDAKSSSTSRDGNPFREENDSPLNAIAKRALTDSGFVGISLIDAIVRSFANNPDWLITFTCVMSRFVTTDSWDTNAELTRRNQKLWYKLGESEPVSNLGAREKIEEWYKQIRYTWYILTESKIVI